MKQDITFSDFCDAWQSHDRNGSFSYEGKRALFDWIEELDADCGTETELDIVALDCEFSEHASAWDCVNDMGYSMEENGEGEYFNNDEREEAAKEYLQENTILIVFKGGVIIQGF